MSALIIIHVANVDQSIHRAKFLAVLARQRVSLRRVSSRLNARHHPELLLGILCVVDSALVLARLLSDALRIVLLIHCVSIFEERHWSRIWSSTSPLALALALALDLGLRRILHVLKHNWHFFLKQLLVVVWALDIRVEVVDQVWTCVSNDFIIALIIVVSPAKGFRVVGSRNVRPAGTLRVVRGATTAFCL